MTTVQKSLDTKLGRILSDPGCRDFIIADAKDADMAFGLAAPGLTPGADPLAGPFRSIEDYREQIRGIVADGHVDIMLMSGSTSGVLTIDEGLFDNSPVTPAVRLNDTTDIWLATGTGRYGKQPALPFSTCTIHQAQYGCVEGSRSPSARSRQTDPDRVPGANLGLFSLTLNDDAEADRAMLTAYREFRIEAEQQGFQHFLEVFYPNCIRDPDGRGNSPPATLDRFLADHVVRCLAGVPASGRPIFLKIPYLGPTVMEQLASYDRSLVVGILGGSAGTTHDAFALVADAKRHGARVALFGRKINAAEDQRAFVRFLRAVADEELSAEEGVRAYHGHLETAGIPPHRPLTDDLVRTSTESAYTS